MNNLNDVHWIDLLHEKGAILKNAFSCLFLSNMNATVHIIWYLCIIYTLFIFITPIRQVPFTFIHMAILSLYPPYVIHIHHTCPSTHQHVHVQYISTPYQWIQLQYGTVCYCIMHVCCMPQSKWAYIMTTVLCCTTVQYIQYNILYCTILYMSYCIIITLSHSHSNSYSK